MTRNNLLAVSAILAVSTAGILALSHPTAATPGNSGSTPGSVHANAQLADSSDSSSASTRRAELQQKLQTLRTNRQSALSSKRLAICQKRQTNINNIFARATTNNKKQLAVFEKIQSKVEQFYQNKKLSADGYDAVVATANDKQAAAQAAIDVSEGATFDCTATDGSHPGSAIKQAMTSRHESLQAYRTSVKDLILVVKKALSDKPSTGTSDTSTDSNTTEEQ